MRIGLLLLLSAAFVFAASLASAQDTAEADEKTYKKSEVAKEAEEFFEGTSQGLAELLEKAFNDFGEPNGFITGNEGSGAFIIGARYGEGTLHMKNGPTRKVYWSGPSVGFDLGANAAKVFTLVYDLTNPEDIYRRYPGVDGSAYVVGGLGMNYQRRDSVVLAPIRTGAGLRLGANIGYLHYTRKRTGNPF